MTIKEKLIRIKKKTKWPWERMNREFHRVMGHEGPSHTTLYRYASGKIKRPNTLVERYISEAIGKIEAELNG